MRGRVYIDMCAWGADDNVNGRHHKTYYFQCAVYRIYIIDHKWGTPLDIRQLHFLS